MDLTWMAKQLIDFQKTTFDNTYQTALLLQNHTERVAGTLMAEAGWMPEEGKKALGQWVEIYKKGQQEWKSVVDDQFVKMADAVSAIG